MQSTIQRGATMKPAPHGGDIQTYIEQYGHTPLDFSANTNPLGMPPKAKQAVVAALEGVDHYPDPYCRSLRSALAAHESVKKEHILCGNGAADLLYRLVLAARPKKALICAPSFAEYAAALRLAGCAIEYHLLQEEDGFALTAGILQQIRPGLGMLFLCEPNNPTGLVASRALLLQIAARCRQTGTLLVVDECFNGFLLEPEAHSLKRLVAEMPGLVIIKAFTKLYGMAGLRLGYLLCSDNELLAGIAAAGQHWPVSSLAQAAGVVALEDSGYLRETAQLVAAQRAVLARGLAKAGCRVYPGAANYLFFHAGAQLGAGLAAQGILLRDCSNYPGLSAGYYRVAVRRPEENRRLLAALEGQ